MSIAYAVYKLNAVGFSLYGFEMLLILAGLVVNLMTKGIQLNFDRKQYREYVAVAGLKSGKWIVLPEIEYVSVFNQQIVKQGGVQSISYKDKHKVLIVRLFVNEVTYYDVASFESEEKAMKIGHLCAKKLNTKLLDYSEGESKWVELSDTK